MYKQAPNAGQIEHQMKHFATPCKLWSSNPFWILASLFVIWKQDEIRSSVYYERGCLWDPQGEL